MRLYRPVCFLNLSRIVVCVLDSVSVIILQSMSTLKKLMAHERMRRRREIEEVHLISEAMATAIGLGLDVDRKSTRLNSSH